MASSNNPLNHLTPLSENVALYAPAEPGDMLIICCTWMNAASKHIAKYTGAYSSKFPKATILLIRNTLPDMFRSQEGYRTRLSPAVSVVRKFMQPQSGTKVPKILFHVFSNGGVNQAVELSSAFIAAEGRPIPAHALILDSSPGKGTYWRSYPAVAVALPRNAIFNIISPLLVHTILCCIFLYSVATRSENKIAMNWSLLNDSLVFHPRSKRVYIYSLADVMVRYDDVEESMKDAEKKGWMIEGVRFEQSAHATHILEDADRYWKAVTRALETARL